MFLNNAKINFSFEINLQKINRLDREKGERTMRMNTFTIILMAIIWVIGGIIANRIRPWIFGTELILPPIITIKYWSPGPVWMNFGDWLADLPARIREMLLIPQDLIYLALLTGLAVILLAFYQRTRPECLA